MFPQVVWEVLSLNNTVREMREKRQFYRRHGADEYYELDPDTGLIEGWTRDGRRFADVDVDEMNGWVSPRLGVRFETGGAELVLYRPDGTRFPTFDELDRLATTERHRADEDMKRAEAAEAKAARLLAKLREAGLDTNGE